MSVRRLLVVELLATEPSSGRTLSPLDAGIGTFPGSLSFFELLYDVKEIYKILFVY